MRSAAPTGLQSCTYWKTCCAAVADEVFLTAYYTGLRGELERGLPFGRRRRDKFDRGGPEGTAA